MNLKNVPAKSGIEAGVVKKELGCFMHRLRQAQADIIIF
jgi:hypothetical protein